MSGSKLDSADYEDIEDWLSIIEDKFHIKFADDAFSEVQTFGELLDFIINKIPHTHVDTCTTQQAFYKLKSAISRPTALNISPSTPLLLVFPKKGRRENVTRVEQFLGFKIQLLKPHPMISNSLWISLLVCTIAIFQNLQTFGLPFLVTIVGLFIAYRFGTVLTYDTVGDLVHAIVRDNYLKVRRKPDTMNRNELENILLEIIKDSSSVRAKLTRDTPL